MALVTDMIPAMDLATRKQILRQGLLVLRSVKISADGALGSRGAALHDDYSDSTGQQGLLLHNQLQLERLVSEAMQANFQVNTHAIGDKANTMVLNAYEKWLSLNHQHQLRHRIEHAQVVRPQDLARFKSLNIILKTSFKPCCGRFLLDIYRFFRTFALTVWVIPLSGQITEKNL